MVKNLFNEATRVQIPALLHLTRLGYSYWGKIHSRDANRVYDPDTNILIEVFKSQFAKLNPDHKNEAVEVLREIRQELDNDDLGRSFYQRLTSVSPVRLIDFDYPENNVFHCTAEFTYKNGMDEFRPDITLFINGLPLVFIEVKKPIGGMLAESRRMNEERLPNRKFRRFINITQLMLFSNNMEYDAEGGITPIQGVFYCTAARKDAKFSTFREENPHEDEIAPFIQYYSYRSDDEMVEKQILTDFNAQVLWGAPEYQTNKNINTPTNRVLTSLCSPKRLLFMLRYGLAYVRMEKEVDGKIVSTDQKHIMRYQQFFACLAILEKLEEGKKSGVIWHTQGSGKTALSYYLNGVLTDYYARKNQVAKFYFIVDRLDLLEQASEEFESRGLQVKTASTRAELMKQFRTNQSLEGDSGTREVTVVNIQRFTEDKTKVSMPQQYATNLQRIFIVDEAHRGYNPTGSFLANLFNADPEAVKIALTGTPLLKKERESWKVFGDYIHTYYYDKSIKDGYTLKIIREDIETRYREKLSKIYKDETLLPANSITKNLIVEHESYVKELLRYVIDDLYRFRQIEGDNTLGGMVICQSSKQAKMLYEYFDKICDELRKQDRDVAPLKAGLILFDSDDKDIRKQIIKDFKKNGTIDILIVYNMLLTGFDAPRLKRLYIGRKLKDHNLLQALTRVNRPYKNMRYGYVIDFADIKENFDQTNQAYLDELNRFREASSGIDGGRGHIVNVIEDPQALIEKVREARQKLFNYNLNNAEKFSQQISKVEQKETLLEIKEALLTIKETYNVVKAFGDEKLKATMQKLQIENLPSLISEVSRAIVVMNEKTALEGAEVLRHAFNEFMTNIEFTFCLKGRPEEMRIVNNPECTLKEAWRQTLAAFAENENIDPEDPEYVTLKEAFMKRCQEHGFKINNLTELQEELKFLKDSYTKLLKLKEQNQNLASKYEDDMKFARIHKRIREENTKRTRSGALKIISAYDEELLTFLLVIKHGIDELIFNRNDILKKNGYFEQVVMEQLFVGLKKLDLTLPKKDRSFLRTRIAREYLDQYTAARALWQKGLRFGTITKG